MQTPNLNAFLTKKFYFKYPVHPILFAVYSVIFLFTHNMNQTEIYVIFKPLLVVLTATLILWFLISRLVRNIEKSALITSLVLIAFFTFGHAHESILLAFNISSKAFKPAYMLIPYLIALTLTTLATLRTEKEKQFSKIMHIVTGFLLLFSLVQISAFEFRKKPSAKNDATSLSYSLPKQRSQELPDIYYIIPDSYASSELLKNSFDYDNGPFEEELKKRGFFTVPDAKSNYVHTYLSLTSSLNGLHLDTLTDIIGADYSDISALHAYISDNKVMRFLKSLGYNIVNLSSGWGPTASLSIADKNINYFEAFDEFTFALAYTTMYKIFHKYHPIRHKTRRTLYYLENSEIFEGPKFLMAHIDSPHPPNTFGPKGEWVKDTEPFYKGFLNKKRYLDEITFFNGKFLRIIDSIRAKSKTEPVIIIQADHGPMFLSVIWRDEKQKFTDEAMVERSSILNTILLPSKCREHLYDTLTPVNTFRIMTNCLFRTNFKMLPDDTYWSIFKKPFKLKKINHILAKRAPQR